MAFKSDISIIRNYNIFYSEDNIVNSINNC